MPNHNPPQSAEPAMTAADKTAYAFYSVAALSALVGQVWAGVEHIPWPSTFPIPLKIALVTPPLAVIELGGVATSALADVRRRIGERALIYRSMSLFAAAVAAGFNLIGHWSQPYLAIGFTGLSTFAYVLWLAHSSARRRDALRHAGMLAKTAPVYGPVQWLKEFGVTRRARALALENGYGLYESLRVARDEIRVANRRKAIGEAIEGLITAHHGDEVHARIARTTYDLDRIADEAEKRADYPGYGEVLSWILAPPPPGPVSPRTAEAPALPGTATQLAGPTLTATTDATSTALIEEGPDHMSDERSSHEGEQPSQETGERTEERHALTNDAEREERSGRSLAPLDERSPLRSGGQDERHAVANEEERPEERVAEPTDLEERADGVNGQSSQVIDSPGRTAHGPNGSQAAQPPVHGQPEIDERSERRMDLATSGTAGGEPPGKAPAGNERQERSPAGIEERSERPEGRSSLVQDGIEERASEPTDAEERSPLRSGGEAEPAGVDAEERLPESTEQKERSERPDDEVEADMRARAFALLDKHGEEMSGAALARELDCSQSHGRRLKAKWRSERRSTRLFQVR